MFTLEERPKRFKDIIGHNKTITTIKSIVSAESFPRTFLFTGDFGSGKTTTARVVAMYLNCHQPQDGEPCGKCSPCAAIVNGVSNSLVEIDSAVHGTAESVRTLSELVTLSVSDNYRVVVLDECHAMSGQAYNALLKVMEETPDTTVFILVTTDPHKVPETIKSRALRFYFHSVESWVIRDSLTRINEDRSLGISEEVVNYIAENAPSVRDAYKILEAVSLSDSKSIEVAYQFLGGDPEMVKTCLRDVLTTSKTDESFVNMIQNNSIDVVVNTLLGVVSHLKQGNQISASVYKAALDIIWGMSDIKHFDSRGRTMCRLGMLRLGEALHGRI